MPGVTCHLVGLVAELTAERFSGLVRGLVFLQQGGAAEHLVTGGALVELFGVNFLDVLLMLLKRSEAEAAALAVVRLRHIWSTGEKVIFGGNELYVDKKTSGEKKMSHRGRI